MKKSLNAVIILKSDDMTWTFHDLYRFFNEKGIEVTMPPDEMGPLVITLKKESQK